ncbi:MAG TPA: BON domain-containing protein [Vicinamibacterales bacterium]|jgi:osmotically-inducible protein OsmY
MRTLLRAVLILIVVVGLGFLVLGWWAGSSWRTHSSSPSSTVGTSGATTTEKARERGAEIGEKSAVAAEKVKNELADAALTGKIKAKMALDDTVRSRSIDVTTDGSVVTLSGSVRSASERQRAVSLAGETEGVTRVVDHLSVGQ